MTQLDVIPRSRKPVGVAIVGLGAAGIQHLRAVESVPEISILAGVDIDPERSARARLPAASLAEVMASPAVEAVAVCLPPQKIAPVAEAVLAAGKHILVEKPPAASTTELDSLVEQARAASRQAAVMFQHRFCLPIEAIGALGTGVASLVVSRPRALHHYGGSSWRARRETALGGVTVHLGSHYLDLACQLLGVPHSVSPASRRDAAPGIDVELSATVEFESGTLLSVHCTSLSTRRVERLTVLSGAGWLEIENGECAAELSGRPVRVAARSAEELRAEVYREFACAVREVLPGLPRSALSRSRGVTEVLQQITGSVHGRTS